MVSVVIPVYKVEKYLPLCIESLLNQSYNALEVLLIDDGSPDECGIICDRYATKDSRIRVIHQSNGGLSDARNKGIDIAAGEYITFVDGDDFVLPDILGHAVYLAEKNNADIVTWQNIRCGRDDNLQSIRIIPKVSEDITILTSDTDQMVNFLTGNRIGTTAWAKLYKSDLFREIRYPVGKLHEDIFTTYQLVHKAKTIVTTTEIGYVYRKSENSITSEKFSERHLDAIDGKIVQAEFVETYYPELKDLAYVGIVYSCNQCLLRIARSNYQNKAVLKEIQQLYRRYSKYYLKGKSSVKAKIFTIIAAVNIHCILLLGDFKKHIGE